MTSIRLHFGMWKRLRMLRTSRVKVQLPAVVKLQPVKIDRKMVQSPMKGQIDTWISECTHKCTKQICKVCRREKNLTIYERIKTNVLIIPQVMSPGICWSHKFKLHVMHKATAQALLLVVLGTYTSRLPAYLNCNRVQDSHLFLGTT